MPNHYVLVDLENLVPTQMQRCQQPGVYVRIFVGAKQVRILSAMAAAVQPLGASAQYIRASGTGKNALDFHLAFYLGELAAQDPSAKMTVISKDQGFDPLIQHLKQRQIKAARHTSVESAIAISRRPPAGPAQSSMTPYIITQLTRMKGNKPASEKTLNRAIKNWCPTSEVQTIINELKQQGYITVKGSKVSYLLSQ